MLLNPISKFKHKNNFFLSLHIWGFRSILFTESIAYIYSEDGKAAPLISKSLHFCNHEVVNLFLDNHELCQIKKPKFDLLKVSTLSPKHINDYISGYRFYQDPSLSLKYTNNYISGYRFYQDRTLSPKHINDYISEYRFYQDPTLSPKHINDYISEYRFYQDPTLSLKYTNDYIFRI